MADILEGLQVEYLAASSSHAESKESDFDSLFIIDRTIDFLTPLKTQFTYEGMIDEMFGINSCEWSINKGFVELDNSIFTERAGPSSLQTKSKKVLLNETDLVFKDIRDKSFEVVGDILNSTALSIKQEEDVELVLIYSPDIP